MSIRFRHGPVSPWAFGIVLGLARLLDLFPGQVFAQSKPPEAARETIRDLQARLSAFISQPRFSASAWGVQVASLETGQTLFEHNANKLMKPASNAKLYTAALALDRLGPDYRIKTSLYATARPDARGTLPGDLIVYGRGDPSFAARFNNGEYQKSLEPLVDAVIAAGLKRVEGDLVGDESYFRGPPFGSGWTWDDLQYYYGAEVSSLSVEDNVLDLVFNSGSKIGEPCQITVNPLTTFVKFINQTTTASKGTSRKIDLYRPLGENTVYVSGRLPLGATNQTDAVAVNRPAGLFVALFREALDRRGITISGGLRTVNWMDHQRDPAAFSDRVEIASVESRPLTEILGKMMKPSQNLYAHLLLLQVGAVRPAEVISKAIASGIKGGEKLAQAQARPTTVSPALPSQSGLTSEELGLAEMAKFLQEVGIKKGEVLLEEGSGLSRGCLVTPHATVELLRFMSRHKQANVFRAALPVGGVDGTLRNRMKESKVARNLQAKTGRLRYVDALSGYVTTAGGEEWVFSAMLNNHTGPLNSGRDAVDALAVSLANFAGKTPKPTEGSSH